MNSIELNNFWENIKGQLIDKLPENVHPWITPLVANSYDNGVLTVVTGQMMGCDLLKRKYYNDIVGVIKDITNDEDSDFNIIFDETAAKKLKKENEKLQKRIAESAQKEHAMENLSNMQSSANLNLKYKFENFVVGKNNEFAYKVAKSVAENPAQKYNPLFIYGSAGLGKTHLMQAIGHYAIFKNQRVKYTKTEDYIDDFISNSRNSKDTVENMSKFNKKYSNVDIILIDDIQLIESKQKTMQQMQRTFDNLYNKGKQIVITSDRLPKDIPTLTKALSSRFEQGLMVELISPDKQNRFDILKKLANESGLKYTDEALDYISDNFVDNVRELEGAFNRVCAYAEINSAEIDLNMAQNVLKCVVVTKKITLSKIAEVTANYYNLDQHDIIGPSRNQKVSSARQMAVYLSRELCGNSFVSIAEFYNRKYPTIMFAYDKIKRDIQRYSELANAAREIRQALKVN